MERGATPPRCVSGKRGEFSECNSGLSSELPPSSAHSSVRQSAASRAGVRCWVRPRMRPTRARAPTTRAPRGATVGWGAGTSCGDISLVPVLQVSDLCKHKKGRAPEWLGRALLGRAAAASFGRRPAYR